MEHRCCSRRDLLRGALGAAAGVLVTPVIGVRSARAAVNAGIPGRFLVVINMLGGNDGLNTVVPTHVQTYYDRRPNLKLTSGLLDLDGRYMLHPELVNLKQMWTDGDLAVVHKVGYPNANLSHFTSQDIYSYGIRNFKTVGDGRGWLGRFADIYCSSPSEPLGVVSVGLGQRPDFFSDAVDPLVLNNVATFNVTADPAYASDHNLRVKAIREAKASETQPPSDPGFSIQATHRQAYDLVDRVQQGTAGWVNPGTYPNNTLGNNLRTVSQLLQGLGSFGTKVFYTGYGGFDTHADQLTAQARLLDRLDNAVGAFAADLKLRGLWDDCTVVVISEFGRRNFENGSFGTDHGHGNAWLVLGGPVDGGRITGDLTSADLLLNEPAHAFDFREVYSDLVGNHLGIDPTPLFPESFVDTGSVDLIS